ncbi:hypothetical protein KOI35_35395 [Actinoplanes bogorensis]|uniref:Uncharacterized protein n=1 Tax=Paractinoplanes bogorensis TaxID=1610840 RepID=A0ABS5YZD6_9ACTN|nr:hypothetical protein [Actinoplanes bogorensis]MBU2668810.1 hypothetical protein [Actinoplanes bogorensis]
MSDIPPADPTFAPYNGPPPNPWQPPQPPVQPQSGPNAAVPQAQFTSQAQFTAPPTQPHFGPPPPAQPHFGPPPTQPQFGPPPAQPQFAQPQFGAPSYPPPGFPPAGQPGYPPAGYPAYPQPGAPAPKPRSVLKVVLMAVALGAILLVGLGTFGVSALIAAAADPAKNARAGDCLTASGTVADTGTSETSAERIDCTSPRAEFTVVARVEGESSPDSTACEKFFPDDEKYFVYGSTAGGGYVLCLRPKG